MKIAQQHLINTRTLITYKSLADELKIDKQKNYLFDLSYLGILDIAGDKALDFLQGQLSSDLRLVSDIQMMPAAQCNLKGRILSLLNVVLWNGVKIVLPRDLIEPTQDSLIKTAMLSRVAIKENTKVKAFGYFLQDTKDLMGEKNFFPKSMYGLAQSTHYCYYHLGNGFYIFIINEAEEAHFCSPFIKNNQFLGSLTWHTLRLFNQNLEIYPDSRGLFLPHRLDLQQTPFLSFDKGCYKGQEIIARTHYRATLKHEMKYFIVSTNERLYSGQRLFKIDEQSELGELIDYSPIADNQYLIAVSLLKEPALSARFEGHSHSVNFERINHFYFAN